MPSAIKTSLLVFGFFVVFLFIIFIFNMIYSLRGHSTSGVRVTIGEHTYDGEVADTAITKLKGLSGRKTLAPGHGMLFPFSAIGSYPFWMQGMNFPIDFIWIREHRVVGVSENAQPETNFVPKIYKSTEPVDAVFEVPAGTVANNKIQIGDGVLIEPIQ